MTRDELSIAWKMFGAGCTLAQAEAVLCNAPLVSQPTPWIAHTSGDKCPVASNTRIFHKGADYGEVGPHAASIVLDWSLVTHYRYAV